MNAENSKSASLWTKAPVANLVRYEPSGIYFTRAKVHGKLVRKSLDTNILSHVRGNGSGKGGYCADAIEFFSYAGPRLKEAARIYGRDCSFLKNEIIIRGDPITGTKNWEIRRLPMIPEMQKLLERLKAEGGEKEFLDNPVLKVRKFNRSLKNACKKLGLHHLTHHDLRHLFATRCIESGVDIPSRASGSEVRWMVDGKNYFGLSP